METNGLQRNCEILQIAAKRKSDTFAVYVKPAEAIFYAASAIHGITASYGQLFLHGKPVTAIALKDALVALLEWLISLNNICCIAVHNLQFDGPRLIKAISKHSLNDEFKKMILGFADTLSIIRKTTNRKASSISALCKDLNVCNIGAHDTVMVCAMLSLILRKLKISDEIILDNLTLFEQQVYHWTALENTHSNFTTLTPLKAYVGDSIGRKLAESGITFLFLTSTYATEGKVGLIEIIERKLQHKLQKASLNKICLYFEQNLRR